MFTNFYGALRTVKLQNRVLFFFFYTLPVNRVSGDAAGDRCNTRPAAMFDKFICQEGSRDFISQKELKNKYLALQSIEKPTV